MARHLVLASGSCGKPGDEAALAGAVALLLRRGPTAILTTDPISDALLAAQPALTRIPFAALASALADCEMLGIVGALVTPAAFEHAALHVAAARASGVPVALLAVRVDEPPDDASRALLDEILSPVEAASAADAASAALLARGRGRRVEVACPLEFLATPFAGPQAERAGVALHADLLRRATPAVRMLLATALAECGFASVEVIGEPGDPVRLDPLALLVRTTAPAVHNALAGVRLAIGGPDPSAHALALACGAVPVAVVEAGATSPLHERLGLSSLVVQAGDGPEALGTALGHAAAISPSMLARRIAPVRALGTRALGALASAARARALEPRRAHPATCDVVARALEIVVAPALERGDAIAASRILDPWREALADRPSWAASRARTAALFGADNEAIALLARALETAPDDLGCLAELARAQLRRGDTDGARRTWEAVSRLDPLAALPHAELGSLALCAGRPSQALAHWSEALGRDPDHPCARAARACLESDPPAALRWWRALAERHPGSSTVWYGLGLAAGSAGDWESARAYLDRALALDPDAGPIEEALGQAIARRDASSARALVDRARRLPTPSHQVARAPSTAV